MTEPEQTSKNSNEVIDAFKKIVGAKFVLTSSRKTTPFSKGYRFGGGPVFAVVRPATLVEMWKTLQVCVDNDLIVICQASNTGLTGGSGPSPDQRYDRPVVIISTHRISQVFLINDAREAISLAGTPLTHLTDVLAQAHRETHSVIGSTSIGASVIGGISNNSGGSQIRKGPAFTREAIYARVNEHGKVELVNHLGIALGDDPEAALDRLQHGNWKTDDVTAPPADSHETEYAKHLRDIVPSPARYNANPDYLYEASGSAGKLMVFAVRTRTFPLEVNPTMFYIGVNDPHELEEIRRMFLESDMELPISGEYMGRLAFDMAEKYGKDTFIFLNFLSPKVQTFMFTFKTWVNGIFAKLPGFGPTFADTVSQAFFSIFPNQLPKRMMQYRNRFEHHLLLTVSAGQKEQSEQMLKDFFAKPEHGGDFFICSPEEAKSANLNRFGAASAATRFAELKRRHIAGLIPIDVALRRDDWDWLEVLPKEIEGQLVAKAYYGHFFCHVMHQDYVAKQGVDAKKLHDQIQQLLEERGAKLPAEHNYGRLYHLPPEMEQHFKELDPTNTFNAGLGGTSTSKDWA
ncbi:MAG: D-lactate dehydrogenase [Bifidobacterium aquikefiri]|uniref:Lactate dehydrogenase n=1 Tax=Bifidobacterium aquikefiri TaxID=1653207 RepID=A0A261G291_9BIFI|nr:D-lactate dehydrogenase [Bifidobacterium aquikefiri]OZG65564.1 lactate dehydrogenase [Bifidobacterium aquikefiri]